MRFIVGVADTDRPIRHQGGKGACSVHLLKARWRYSGSASAGPVGQSINLRHGEVLSGALPQEIVVPLAGVVAVRLHPREPAVPFLLAEDADVRVRAGAPSQAALDLGVRHAVGLHEVGRHPRVLQEARHVAHDEAVLANFLVRHEKLRLDVFGDYDAAR